VERPATGRLRPRSEQAAGTGCARRRGARRSGGTGQIAHSARLPVGYPCSNRLYCLPASS